MKRIGLALGGGGARGIAHIAYLKALDDMGLRPSVISGTSSGAIAGALYAGGMSPGEMLEKVQSLFSARRGGSANIGRIWTKAGTVGSAVVKTTLERTLPKKTFEELAIPLRIVATNYHTLAERVFVSGEIIEPLMASIAFPGIFAPQPVKGEFYVDGGATNIVPFDIIRRECDLLIAIDVSAVRPNSDLKPSAKGALHASWAAAQEALIASKLKDHPVEVFERPTFENVATMEFGKYKQIYSRAEEAIPGFKQKLTRLIKGELL